MDGSEFQAEMPKDWEITGDFRAVQVTIPTVILFTGYCIGKVFISMEFVKWRILCMCGGRGISDNYDTADT